MNFFLQLIKARWIFKKPSKKKILVYDRFSETFAQILFPKIDYEILDVRYESINIYVLVSTLLRFQFKNFRDNYKKIFFNLVSPKLVYTSVDNNLAFFRLKDLYSKAIYISDQNGMRQNTFNNECRNYINKSKNKLKADHIFLFGQNEKKRFSKIIEGNIYTLGNTKNNHYPINRSNTKKKIQSIMFICSATNKKDEEIDKSIFGHLHKYCIKKNIKLIFCSRFGLSMEHFYRKNYGKGDWIYFPRINTASTFKNLNKQQMVVFSHSSLGYQALAKGLRCAVFQKSFPIKGNNVKYPKSGVFWTNSKKYEDFAKLLNRVIAFSNKRWKKIASRYSTEILSYDPANIKKRKIIKMALR
tara:strand:+ start:199 stop:1269 length:1071 start_codon:yes stop_codon:yes gene_type:complete